MLTLVRLLCVLVFLLTVAGGLREQPWPQVFQHYDKLLHFSSFFCLTFLCLLALPRRFHWWCLLMVLLVGAGLEFGQSSFFPKRTADWWDMAANSLGVLLAFITHKLYCLWRPTRQ